MYSRYRSFPLRTPLITAVLLLLSALSPTHAVSSGCPDTLRFADTGIEGAEELYLIYHKFAKLSQELLGIKVKFFPVSNRTIAINALRFNQVDVVLAGPSEYVLMMERLRNIQPIVAVVRPNYYSVFIVPARSDAKTLNDLKGKHIGLKDHGSTTGHIMPSYMLHKAGLDLDRDVRLSMLGGARLAALFSGEVDAVGTGIQDYQYLVQREGEGRYRILEQGESMPGDPFVAGSHLNTACVAHIRRVFMENAAAVVDSILQPGKYEKYLGAHLVIPKDSNYDMVREAYSLLGLRD